MRKIYFVDTTIRDGQASLWAMNMRTKHMLAVMPYLDAAGFDSIEFIATGSRLKKFVRDLKENPWEWIDQGAKAAKATPLRWHGGIGGPSMSGQVSPEIGELLIAKAVERGISQTRTGNNWNDFSVVAKEVERFTHLGMRTVVNVMYSVSPRHTDEYFVRKAKEAAATRPFRLCFKDISGLLTPERTRELMLKMMAVTGDIAWEFHGHCNNGLGPLNALEAAKAGATYLHTAIPPLANASSQPSIYNLARNLRELDFDPQIDEEVLRPATEYLEFIAKREGFEIGRPYEYDQRVYRHQIPGGMISNFMYQLKAAGNENRIDEVLEETARVRADFGYPIMVTPLSQYVGTQAAINVIVGERYRQVTDRTIEYALGRHGGEEALNAMDPDVRDVILDRPRAKELTLTEPQDLTVAQARTKYGDIPDEDLILRAIVGDDAVDVVGSFEALRPRHSTSTPLVQLITELAERDEHRSVLISKGGMQLSFNWAGAGFAADDPSDGQITGRMTVRNSDIGEGKRETLMELTHQDVLSILEVLDRSDFEYFKLELGPLKIVADRHAPRHDGEPVNSSGSVATQADDAPFDVADVPPFAAAESEAVASPSPADGSNFIAVNAPIVGIFYRSPEPGAEPFVKVGDWVEEGQTVALMEVMKMFNGVTASASGQITEILAEDAAFVEFGQTLFLMRPAA